MIELKYPLNAQIELTELCNHRCFYCYNAWQVNKDKNSYMSIGDSNKIVTKIHDEIKPFSITLTGGEPFMNFDVLENFVYKLKKDIDIGINTNLIYATEKNIENLLESNKRFGLLISLPSYKKEQYEFITGAKDLKKFYKNLKFIKENTSINTTINMVVSKYNLNSVYGEGEYLFKEFGIKNFAATPLSVSPIEGCSVENYDLQEQDIFLIFNELLKLKENYGLKVDCIQTLPLCFVPEEFRNSEIFHRPCSTGRTTIGMDYKGNVRSCIQAPFSVANIFETKFEDIWKIFEPFRQDKYLPEDCLECELLRACNGGCRFNDFKEGEPLNRKEPRMKGKILTKQEIKLKKIFLDDSYKVDRIKYREEDVNIHTFMNPNHNLLFVNDEMKNIVLNLKKFGEFNPTKVLEHYENSPELKSKLELIFTDLISKDFLRKIN